MQRKDFKLYFTSAICCVLVHLVRSFWDSIQGNQAILNTFFRNAARVFLYLYLSFSSKIMHMGGHGYTCTFAYVQVHTCTFTLLK